MRIFGKEMTTREAIYLGIVLVIAIGFFLQTWALEKTIKEYQNAYIECENRIALYNNRLTDVWGRNILNITPSHAES